MPFSGYSSAIFCVYQNMCTQNNDIDIHQNIVTTNISINHFTTRIYYILYTIIFVCIKTQRSRHLFGIFFVQLKKKRFFSLNPK